ncbi:XrtA system polysaccharide deacetylase [Janthinobacterium sp. HLX7-2]|uniref:XrtA system polysaccharide deacetylase n=1 Tax=Janthinobacterium sp. HLX7-2 TaxID=1259331 RepID=UPI003F2091B3
MMTPLQARGEGQVQLRNALTVDVEDYFQVSAFAPHIARADWPHLECRIEANIERILLLLEARRIHATFFTLGWIAERYPTLLRRVAQAGHEVASHGYAHLRASEQSPRQFADDVRHSKTILEQLTGHAVLGYRAPSFSIGAANLWAFDVLQEAGYRYSSSIYPIRHDHYGMPDAPRFAWRPRGPQGVLELPVSTVRVRGRNWPAGGGGYFRLLPYPLSRWLLRRINSLDGQAGIFYFHPWELDPGQPRPPGLSARTRFRHYLNLGRMEARLVRLTRDFAWDRMDRIFLEST